MGAMRPSKALTGAVLLYAAARVFLWLRPDLFLFTVEEYSMKAQVAAEQRYRRGQPASPKVVILGSSRLDAVPAEWWPELLDVDASEVRGVMRSGNTFWHSLVFLRRNPEILRNARVVVMDIFPYQLFVAHTFPEEGEEFLKRSTLAERTRVGDWGQRGRAYMDLVVPAWSERHSVQVWWKGLLSTFRGGDWVNARLQAEIYAQETANRDLGIQLGTQRFSDMMRFLYVPDPIVSQVQLSAIQDLCDMIPPDCEIVFIWLPFFREYEGFLASEETARESDRIFKETLRALDHPRASVVWHEGMTASGLVDTDFTDGVHYSDEGLVKACRLIAQDVRERLGE